MRPRTVAGKAACVSPRPQKTKLFVMSDLTAADPPSAKARMPVALPSVTSIVFAPVPGSFEAPTPITRRPAAGAPSVPSPSSPELPAAATTDVPVGFHGVGKAALSDATAVGSSGPPPPPRLMLITFAMGFGKPVSVAGATESSIARTMLEVRQPPTGPPTPPSVDSTSLQTLYDINFACGATP